MKTDLDPTTYLHAEDLLHDSKWGEFSLTIKEVLPPNTVKASDGKLIDKPILVFTQTEKRLVLGKINARLAKCAIGSAKVAEWVGKQIKVYASRGNWFGQKDVAAIRIRVPNGVARPFLVPSQLGVDITGAASVGDQ